MFNESSHKNNKSRFNWTTIGLGFALLGGIIFVSVGSKAQPVQLDIPAQNARLQQMRDNNANYTGNPQLAASAIQHYFQKRYPQHLDSVLSALGATAGFGTQMAIREGFIKPGIVPANQAFVVVNTNEGGNYFFGDFLNQGLFESKDKRITVWSLVGGGAKKAGATALPDIVEIVQYNASSLGTPAFGLPRVPKDHETKELPSLVLRKTWVDVQGILEAQHINPIMWGWVPAMAAQKLIIQNKDKIDPSLAAKIVMESALPMSKMNPSALGIHY